MGKGKLKMLKNGVLSRIEGIFGKVYFFGFSILWKIFVELLKKFLKFPCILDDIDI